MYIRDSAHSRYVPSPPPQQITISPKWRGSRPGCSYAASLAAHFAISRVSSCQLSPEPGGGGGDCGTLRTYMHTVSALGGAGGLARGKGMYCTELSRAELSGRASPIRSDLASTCRSLVSLWGRAADGRRYDTSIRLHTWLFSASRRSDGRTDGGALSSRRRACPADPIAAAEP